MDIQNPVKMMRNFFYPMASSRSTIENYQPNFSLYWYLGMNLYGFGDNHIKVKDQRSVDVKKPVKRWEICFVLHEECWLNLGS